MPCNFFSRPSSTTIIFGNVSNDVIHVNFHLLFFLHSSPSFRSLQYYKYNETPEPGRNYSNDNNNRGIKWPGGTKNEEMEKNYYFGLRKTRVKLIIHDPVVRDLSREIRKGIAFVRKTLYLNFYVFLKCVHVRKCFSHLSTGSNARFWSGKRGWGGVQA